MMMKHLAVLLLVPITVTAFSASSSFIGGRAKKIYRPPFKKMSTNAPTLVMYDNSRDPPSNEQFNAWTVLSTTEEWISNTLASAETAAGNNPYTRKEVSYIHEPSSESAMIVAGLFRRLKEARELGEQHGSMEEDRADEQGDDYDPSTLRQTNVVVIPANKHLSDSFFVFNDLIETINQARRNARDYVTDDDDNHDDTDWIVAVNCAHLHPKFGQKTPQQELQEMQQEEQAGEVDLNYQEYKEKRLQARQSPYPTVVIEVRATPPIDFGETPSSSTNFEQVTSSDVQKLEALFGKSAHVSQGEDAFYDALKNHVTEISPLQPIELAQQWMAQHDPLVEPRAAFTETDTTQVDAAYEFVFTNIAMLQEQASTTKRQYLVMPHFLSRAATSLEKFCLSVQQMLQVLPDLRGKIDVTTFHPEHIDANKRSPMPVLCLQWNE